MKQLLRAFHWIVFTDTALLTRVAVGVAIFAALALIDLRRNGRRATRWREYLFLLASACVAMAYGAVNDLITSRISWEYFLYGKDLLALLGPAIPPDAGTLAREAAKVGIKATWSAGLIIGVVILIANNPRRGLLQLQYSRLFRFIPGILLCCIAGAIGLGLAGSFGWLAGMSSDFGEMVRHDEFRPYRFMAVFGVHLGGYAGGAIGAGWAAAGIHRERKRISQG